ncbi:AcrR family transcriptional regulator [Kibdelosporangium banguiense]|uniref:AcrR family transcriptional regulator n=1 Tax=Kibdelosporangium banguiense TaxID=1365924 RepID=A0ABS4U030_9PSEU|nr:helix-turn-helix domain-containing protein [Kibdelosporangium banguiense]MBP2330016.1 AcrR family transcriptional regulator [Kibdelosporangium banguiense]
MSGDTRDRILQAARDLFTARTYGATSMREIAERVGITKPSMYHHFSNKAEILDSLVRPPIDELHDVLLNPATPKDVLSGCITVMLKHRETMTLLLRDASVYGEESTKTMTEMLDIVNQATELLAPPKPDWQDRLRAAQAFAAATDPISFFPNVPQKELHDALLDGALALLSARRDD